MSVRRNFKRGAFHLRRRFGPEPSPMQMTGLLGRTPELRITPAGEELRVSKIPSVQLVGQSLANETQDLSRALSHIRYQGQTGACNGFACAAAAEIMGVELTQGAITPPSAFWFYFWARKEWGLENVDGGSYVTDGIRMMVKHGVVPIHYMDDDSSPYDLPPEVPTAERWHVNDHRQIARYTNRDRIDAIAAVRECLQFGIPVIIGIHTRSFSGWRNVKRTGRFPKTDPAPGMQPDHAVCICQALTIEGELWFKFINSWGRQWGDNGCGYFPASYLMSLELACDPQTFSLDLKAA